MTLLLSQVGIDDAMKDRLEKIADAADTLEDANRTIAKLNSDREAIVRDQDRLRQNLRAAAAGSDLAKLETKKLLDQEAKLDSIDSDLKTAQASVETARTQLEEFAGKAVTQELRFMNKKTL